VVAIVAVMPALVALAEPAASQLSGTGAFVIDKVMSGDVLLRGTVTLAVSCSNGRQETISIAPGVVPAPQVIGGLAAGTKCTVTEPVTGANSDVLVGTQGVPAEITANPAVTPTVRIVNTYITSTSTRTPPPGSLIVTKLFQGDAALRSDVQIRVQCGQVPGFPNGTFDETQTIPAGTNPAPPLVFAPIAAPADCTVTETVTGANGAVSVTVVGEGTFRVNPNEDLRVTLTDTYEAKTGTLRVRKVIDGAGASLRGVVQLRVSCTDGTTATLVVPTGQTEADKAVGPIVATSTCTVTETTNGAVPGVVSVATTPAGPQTVTIAADTESVVEVRDTYTAVGATLQITKVINGTGAGHQGQVQVDVRCSDGTTASFTVPAQAAAGQYPFAPLTVPSGTTCALAEPSNGATAAVDVATDFAPGTVVRVAGPTAATVTNTYTAKPGGLVVTKVVAGDGVDLRGPVTLTAVCDGATAGTVTYPPGATLDPLVITPLPAGASCTVSETADGAIPGTVTVATAIAPAQPVTIPAGANAGVTVTDTYTSVLGSLTVTKSTAGLDEFRGPVTISAVCTPVAGAPVTASRTYPVRSPLSPPLVLGGLPAGTTCQVTEPDTGASSALAVTTTPTLPVTVTIGPAEKQVVTITNTYTAAAGSVIVSKAITGSMAGHQGAVAITATCGGTPTTFDVPAGATSPAPFSITGLTAGTTCVITEPVDGSSPAIDVTTTPPLPLTVTIPAGASASAAITDQYEPAPATLTVAKAIAGTAAGEHGLISIRVDCGSQHTAELIVPAGALSALPVVLNDIPAPASCTVTEPLDGATDTVAVTTTGLGPVALAPGDNLTATVTDTYAPRPAQLVLTKVITGAAAAHHGPVAITATCGTTTGTLSVPAGDTNPTPLTLDGIAPGSTCTVDETADGSTPTVAVSTFPAVPLTIGPATAGGTLAATITDEYTSRTGSVLVVKQVSGLASNSRGPITLDVGCSDGTTVAHTYLPSDALTPFSIAPVPFGTTCTVTEPQNGGLPNDVDVVGPTFAPGNVVTVDGPVVGVAVGNSYSFATGIVALVKQFDGPAAAQRGTVRIQLACGDQTAVINSLPGEAGPVTTTLEGVPRETRCTATELNNGATSAVAVSTVFDPARSVTAVAGQTVTMTVTNTYTPNVTGSLLLEATLTGPAEPQRSTVRLTITCDSGRRVTLTVPAGRSPDPALLGGLPAGARCTITQPLNGDTASIVTSTTGLPATPVVVAADQTSTVAVTDLYTRQVTPTPPPTSTPPPTPAPPPPTSPSVPTPPTTGSGGQLPATGNDADRLLAVAIGMSVVGAIVCGTERRTRRRVNRS
jgi:hypothetical protein